MTCIYPRSRVLDPERNESGLSRVNSIGSPSTTRLLVFGGPYSNLRATQALRAKAAELGCAPSEVICTGDLVAYCAEPEETTQAIRDWGCHVIAGNCE